MRHDNAIDHRQRSSAAHWQCTTSGLIELSVGLLGDLPSGGPATSVLAAERACWQASGACWPRLVLERVTPAAASSTGWCASRRRGREDHGSQCPVGHDGRRVHALECARNPNIGRSQRDFAAHPHNERRAEECDEDNVDNRASHSGDVRVAPGGEVAKRGVAQRMVVYEPLRKLEALKTQSS